MQFAKVDLGLKIPLMNAAGALGFAPEANHRVDYSYLGAFITHPVSLLPRMPAQGVRYSAFPGGFLLHTGLPNPGLKKVIRRYRDAWQRASLPIWVHIFGQDPGDVEQMVLQLEEVPGVAGFELGMSSSIDPKLASELVQASLGELPLMIRIPFERVVDLAEIIAKQFPQVILSLGPPRGKLIDHRLGKLVGRLYGPAIYPQALLALEKLLRNDVPVIAAGGVYSPEKAKQMLEVGAAAVQLDAVLWRDGLYNWHID